MSIEAMNWANRQRTGSSTLKLVLLRVANYADQENKAWPSQKRLAWDTELSERAVRNSLARLEEMKLIVRIGRRGAEKQEYLSDMIHLCVEPEDPETQRYVVPGQRHVAPDPAARRSKPPAPGAGASGTLFPDPAAPGAANPSGEPSEEASTQPEPRSGGGRADLDELIPEWFDLFWDMFPNKVDRNGAKRSFTRVLRSGQVSFQELMDGLQRYLNKSDNRNWCFPTTWLNQSRWAEVIAQPPQQDARQPSQMGRRWG